MAACLRGSVLGILLWGSLQAGNAIAGETAREIERLLEGGAAGQAYELGLARSAKEAGDPEFDFAFALAALEVGHPERAVFALERVLLLFPENDRVRLEFARAHFMLGNFPEARTQFEIVLTHKPPQNVRERIQLFLAKIREQETAVRPTYHAFTAVRLGHDTNVNSATASTSVNTPALGPVSLLPGAVELASNFVEFELSGEALRPISKKKALFGQAAVIIRDNFDVDFGFDDEFDTAKLQLRGGISFLGKRSVFRLPIQYENLFLDRDEFRRILLVGGEWERAIGRADRIMPFGQVGGVRYPEQKFRDVDLALLGLTWTHRFPRANKQFRLGLFYGDEENVESGPGAAAVARDYVGLFIGFQWNPRPVQLFFFDVGIQAIEHKAPQPVFGVARDETFVRLRIGWNWQFRPKWTINTELRYDNNDSNLELFTYDRMQIFGGYA
ncbi:MAG: tetratricopeptide repeat protein [Acidiferrobacterales bacterium]